MREPLDEQAVADLLPGAWVLAATNIPTWLSGERRDPRFEYAVSAREPLVLSDDLSYVVGTGKRAGTTKRVVGHNSFDGEGFHWRGTGMLRFFSSRWRIGGASDDGAIAAIHVVASLGTPGGVDIIVREGSPQPELRATIAHSTTEYGLTPEQFASLTWLGPVALR